MNSTNELIRNDLETIISILKNTNDIYNYYQLVSLFNTFKNVIQENKLNVELPREYEKVICKYSFEDIIIKNNKELLDTFIKYHGFDIRLANTYNYIKKYYVEAYLYPNYKMGISFNETKILLSKIFDEYDKEISDFYQEYKDSNRLYLFKQKDDLNDGFVIKGNSIIKPYIFINVSNTLSDLFTLAHEIIHAYVAEKRKKIEDNKLSKIDINNLDEVYSHFIELLIMDYVKKNQVLSFDLNEYKKYYNNSLIDDLKMYKLLLRKKNLFDNKSNIDNFLTIQAYSQGKIIASYFYNQYIQYPNSTKNNLYNFVLKSHLHSKEYMINHYGLKQEDLLKPKYLIKSIS